MKTTIRQLIRGLRVHLPPPIADRAVKNLALHIKQNPEAGKRMVRRWVEGYGHKPNLALEFAFYWRVSREGYFYWEAVNTKTFADNSLSWSE